MDKKKSIAIILASFLFVLSMRISSVEMANSNPIYNPPAITINSPQSITYNVTTIPLSFQIELGYSHKLFTFSYRLDNQVRVISDNFTTILVDYAPVNLTTSIVSREIIEYNDVLVNVSDGWHNITIYSNYSDGYADLTQSSSKSFEVKTISTLSLSPSPSPIKSVTPIATTTLEPTLSPSQNVTTSPIVEPSSIWMAYQLEISAIIIIIAVSIVAVSALAYRKIKRQK